MMTTFETVVSKNYKEWLRFSKSKGTRAYNGKDGEDILHDVLLTAQRKFTKGGSEEEIESYIKLNLVREMDCLPKKINKKEQKIKDLKREDYGVDTEAGEQL